MKIAFPTQNSQGFDSPVFNHFGSAPYFVICDTANDTFVTVSNADQHHAHGQCQPMAALDGHTVDAVAVGGIGGGALRKLQAGGIKVYRAVEGSVGANLALARNGKLPEMALINVCAGHGPGAGCAH